MERSDELEALMKEYEKSEVECRTNRKIYSELERIMMKKQFSEGVQAVTTQVGELKLQDVPSTSRLVKKDSTTSNKSKSRKSNSTSSLKKSQQASAPDRSCFITLQKRILQFESYQNMMKQAPNRHALDFLKLLEAQNSVISRELFESESDV